MLPNTNPTLTKSWRALQAHFTDNQKKTLLQYFAENNERALDLSINHEGFFADFSKNHIDKKTLQLFNDLFDDCLLDDAIKSQFSGQSINKTENRAVGHFALRAPLPHAIKIDNHAVHNEIEKSHNKLQIFSQKVRGGAWTGYTGKPIKNIVNNGIGGSDLGPRMVADALKPYIQEGLHLFFIANVDGAEIHQTLKNLQAEETLFIISSKSFTTLETMTNAQTARDWFLQFANKDAVAKHFVAVSTHADAVKSFGIDPENMFEFWDWVGGRYSIWSAIALPIIIGIGFENFQQFLAGGHAADKHFLEAPVAQNIPKLMAAIGIWYRNFWNATSNAILPYNQNLRYFPAYMQQADMESNGKSVDRNGDKIEYQTGPIIWGQPGTNGQHAFYQLIHQGTGMIPCDFIAAANAHHQLDHHQDQLLANFVAQTEALLKGKKAHEVETELTQKGLDKTTIDTLLPFKVFEGNKPTNTFLMDELSPYNLGKLIAFYEHKIFVQGIIWNVFSFDQWGVELGKTLAQNILSEIEKETISDLHDGSTQQLLKKILDWRKEN